MHPEKRFSLDQKERLRKLGVIAQQIAELERALPYIHRQLDFARNQPRVADVRQQLRTLLDSLERAHHSLQDLESSKRAPREALNYLHIIVNPPHPDWQKLHATLSETLRHAQDHAQLTIEFLPRKPTRHNTADPINIAFIAIALTTGWSASNPPGPFPKKLRPSSSPTSAFYEVAAACFVAVGASNTDPERAIKAYKAKLERNPILIPFVPS